MAVALWLHRLDAPVPARVPRKFSLAALLALSAPPVATGLLATPAAAQAPSGGDMPSVPGADAFDIRYYTTTEDGDRSIAMAQLHFTQFMNKARCECGHQIQTQVRLKSTSGMTYDNSKLVQTFVGAQCNTAETNPAGQFRKCALLATQTVQPYVRGVVQSFHPVWLTNGVALASGDDRDPATAIAAGSCDSGQGESGVWMCAQTDGTVGCQSEEFFITGTQNSNLAKGMTGGVKFDFLPPIQEVKDVAANPGDGAIVVSWKLDTTGDIQGFRVLCEEADTGKPVADKSYTPPALNDIPNGTWYFTKENLCPGGPFSTFNAGNNDPITTDTDGEEATTTATDDGGDSLDAGSDESSAPGECGDGVLDPGEDCDLGDNNADDGACTTACIRQYCGDAIVLDGAEECDDGNLIDNDECTNACKNAACGDGILSTASGETCDLGPLNGDAHALCDDECTAVFAMCGNANKEPGEGCDGEMGCASCKLDTCHDGLDTVDPGEECDGDMIMCTEKCTISVCGDGLLTPPEMCDDGADNSDARECTSECRMNICGDGKVLTDVDNQAIVEECDDGDQNGDSKPCLPTCKRSSCGDGKVGPGEECDAGMGNNVDTGACRSDCQNNRCGDGFTGPGEECDAGDDNADDGLCKPDCTAQGSDGLRALDWSYVCTNHIPYNTTSVRISGLENDKRYNFLLVSYDIFGNPKTYTKIVSAAPVNTLDLWEQCKKQGDVCGESGFCNLTGDSDPLLGLGGLFGLGLGLVGVRRRRNRQRTRA